MKKNNVTKNRLYSLINISIILSVICTVALSMILYYNNSQMNKEMLTRAKTYIRSIEITREWNASTGGVYVEKTPGIKSNPYIKNPDIRSTDGRQYTLKNSSIMTMEMAHLSGKDGIFSYTMRGLKPINPANSPDDFETGALELFKTGQKERYKKIKSENNTFFRYMAPLYAKEECITCHNVYKTGDIIGGISITQDITSIEKNAILSNYSAIVLGILSVFFIAGVLLISTQHLKVRLEDSNKKIDSLSITDELTDLFNRNYFIRKLNSEIERAKRYDYPLTVIITNIDFFKSINEKHGIREGDLVLKSVAMIIKPLCRESDTVARFGEAEFAVILPNTGDKGARLLAEKLRLNVEEYKFSKNAHPVTISLGISVMSPEGAYTAEALIYNADTALYRSQESGKNSVVLYNPE